MNKTTIATRPTFEIDLGEQIICFDSSSSIIHSENVILLGFKRRIVILAIDNNSTNDGEISFNYKKIKDIPDSDSVRILKLCSSIIVRDILFASATNFDVKIYNANESESTCLKTITAHDNYINTMDFTEEFLATGSDDHTCKIFSVRDDYEENIVLNFSSSVTCVKFNPEEPYKLIIGTKNGSMFVYCLRLRQSLFSFQTQSPLMSFDWSTKNPCFVACLVADQIIYYDISKPE
jgi:nuclear pore complex protein Nup37